MRGALVLLVLGCSGVVVACGRSQPAVVPIASTGTITPQRLDSMWAEAQSLMARHKWGKAATLFERVQLELPASDPRSRLARLYVGDARVGEKSNLQAVREYRRVSDEFPTDSLAPEALLRAGDAYARLWRRPELDPTYGQTAQATYQELLSRYPNAPAAAAARARLAALSDKFATKDLKNAQFYYRFKAYDSAVLLLKQLIVAYPTSKVSPAAAELLVNAYRKLGYAEDLRETCGFMRDRFAGSPELARACPATSVAATAETPKAP